MAVEINNANLNKTSLKAYYRFESGALTTDSSGNSHTLTDLNSCSETTGVFGGGVVMGTNDAYSAVNHADFKPTSAFSVSTWFKRAATGSCVISQSYSYNPNVAGWYVAIRSDNTVQFLSGKNNGTVAGTNYQVINGTTNVCDNVWHLITCVWDGSYLRLYVDGVSDNTAVSWANAPAYATTTYVRIGCNNVTGTDTNFITGYLDDYAVWNGKALSAEEIAYLYNGGHTRLVLID